MHIFKSSVCWPHLPGFWWLHNATTCNSLLTRHPTGYMPAKWTISCKWVCFEVSLRCSCHIVDTFCNNETHQVQKVALAKGKKGSEKTNVGPTRMTSQYYCAVCSFGSVNNFKHFIFEFKRSIIHFSALVTYIFVILDVTYLLLDG